MSSDRRTKGVPTAGRTCPTITHAGRADERFDAEGRLTEPTTRQLLERFGAAMVAFVERCRPA